KFNLRLVYFNKGGDVIDYLNNGQPRTSLKVAAFEYFGHSNKACFMFDYSNVIDSSAKAWLHETELSKIDRRICEKLGLSHRRRNEQVLARCDRHAHVGRARQDTIHG